MMMDARPYPPVVDTCRIGNLFLELLPLAIVVPFSPWAIVAVILMLASDRPSNSVWWLTGWTLSTFGIGLLDHSLLWRVRLLEFEHSWEDGLHRPGAARRAAARDSRPVLVARRPSRTGNSLKEPGWMTRIGKMSPIWAFLIGAFWINTTLVVAAGVDTLLSGPCDRTVDRGLRGLHPGHLGGPGRADPLRIFAAQARHDRCFDGGPANGSRGTRKPRSQSLRSCSRSGSSARASSDCSASTRPNSRRAFCCGPGALNPKCCFGCRQASAGQVVLEGSRVLRLVPSSSSSQSAATTRDDSRQPPMVAVSASMSAPTSVPPSPAPLNGLLGARR